jgi:hypothetical protein
VREPAPVIDLAEARRRRAGRSASSATSATPAAQAQRAVATCAITAPVLRLPVARPVAPKPATPPRKGVRQRFTELRTALSDGWEIVQPIFARPLWSAPDDSLTAFNFVLRRDDDTRLVTVPEGRTVARFIRDRQLIVDYRH